MMMLRRNGGKLATLACVLGIFLGTFMGIFALGFLGSSANAAPRASDLGPEMPMAEPSGGFVGQLKVTPSHGPVGTPVAVSGQGFPPEQEFQLVWRTVKGSWKVTTAEYHGREFTPGRLPDRDGEERQGRPHLGKLRCAGGLRLPARRGDPAGRPPAHPDGVQSRYHRKDRRLAQRAGRLTDLDRGAGHWLARARGQLGAALRQHVHRLHVGGDDAADRALHHPRHWARGLAHRRGAAFRFRLALSQYAAIAGAGPAEFQLDYTVTAGRSGAAAAAGAAGADERPQACAGRRAGCDAGIRWHRRSGRGERLRLRAGQEPQAQLAHRGRQPHDGRRLGNQVSRHRRSHCRRRRPRRIPFQHARRSRRRAQSLGRGRRDPEGRHILDCADRAAARRRARPRGHHLPHPSQGRGLVGDRQHLHRGLRQRDLGLCLCVQQPGRH